MKYPIYIFFCLLLSQSFCTSRQQTEIDNRKTINVAQPTAKPKKEKTLTLGAEQTEKYLPYLKEKKVALVVNQTSRIKNIHLVDSLVSLGINIQHIFAPEHGFRGKADAGEHVKNGIDTKTGLPIISLYGKNKKPHKEQLENIDIVLFDIQDVGVRFYTYISTMHYVMEACAEQQVPFIVLDRPNPNGHYVAGPVLDLRFQSFVGMHPIPIVHGLTIGELAHMINDEGWLKNKVKCNLTVVKCKNYTHKTPYILPIKPSPNLPNDLSIKLYPSLCLLEPTEVSVGRGTYTPFQIVGTTNSQGGSFKFIPKSIEGMSKYPKHQDKTCYGVDFRNEKVIPQFTVKYLVEYYQQSSTQKDFFTSESFFNKLAGTDQLLKQVKDGWSAEKIEESWQEALKDYLLLRKQYLIYEE